MERSILSPSTFLSLLSTGDVEACVSELRISTSSRKSTATASSTPAEVAKLLSLTLKTLCAAKSKLLLPFHFAEFHGGLLKSTPSVSNSSLCGSSGELAGENVSLGTEGVISQSTPLIQFRCFLNALFSLLHSGGCGTESAQLRVCALRLIKRAVKHEALLRQKKNGDYSFPLGFFQVCVSIALQIPRANQEYFDCFCDEYIHASTDLRYYSLVVMRKILEEYASRSFSDCSIPKFYEEADSQSENESSVNGAIEKFGVPPYGEKKIQIFQSHTPWYFWARSSTELVNTFFSILSAVPSPQKNMKATDTESVSEERNIEPIVITNPSSQKKRKKNFDDSALNCFIENVNNTKCCSAYNYRQIFQNVWLLFLRCIPRDSKVLESILHHLPKHVLPHLSNPLAFSEYFLSLYANNLNPSLNIVALCGVFYLLTKHRLGDPHVLDEGRFSNSSNLDAKVNAAENKKLSNGTAGSRESDLCNHFFLQLYRLVKPITFSVARRARFLRLLKTALFSPLLPIHLVSLFIKKCARTACLVPPAAALWLLGFIHTLLRKYKNVCMPLLHVPAKLTRSFRIEGDSFDFEEASLTFSASKDGNISVNQEIPAVACTSQHDAIEQSQRNGNVNLIDCLPECFRFNKSDFTGNLREQMHLSLWELELLKKHYYPAVAQMAQLFDTDIFKDSAKNVDIEDFLEITYEKLLKNDLKAKRRRMTDSAGIIKAAAIASEPNIEPPAICRLLSIAHQF
ncbi:CBF/Mak21 family protein [Cardiosporidium cionae]|uniref:CBF/Mak21 family protein n=1 Tax=Cardiosporidium cionae TaxID=476202 RepID=A0ABQ7J7Q5_9APIC|nr:CBF/Mak21 family protein [Cardiosporidium cionae]|eukprot:KAF8820005.1 CBF/Mak21 family protein [Cardiosporidium cionae]